MPDLYKELSFYRRYHYNQTNVLIHVFCIPLIFLSSMWLLVQLRVPESIAEGLGIPAEWAPYLNAAVVTGILYSQYYARLDPLFGIPCAIGIIFASLKFSHLVPYYGKQGVNVAWTVWGISWIAQFIGHGKFEHRAPALLDNLNQALVLAPFFAVFEIAYLLGIRKDIIEKIDAQVLPEIKAFHAKRLAAKTK